MPNLDIRPQPAAKMRGIPHHDVEQDHRSLAADGRRVTALFSLPMLSYSSLPSKVSEAVARSDDLSHTVLWGLLDDALDVEQRAPSSPLRSCQTFGPVQDNATVRLFDGQGVRARWLTE